MTGNTLVPGKASETELCRMMDEYSSMLVGICAILLDDIGNTQVIKGVEGGMVKIPTHARLAQTGSRKVKKLG